MELMLSLVTPCRPGIFHRVSCCAYRGPRKGGEGTEGRTSMVCMEPPLRIFLMTSSSSSVPNSEYSTFLGAASYVPWAPCLQNGLSVGGSSTIGDLGGLPEGREWEECVSVPVREEDFKRRHELGQGDGRVALQPLLVLVYVLDEDEEVVVGALVVDLGLRALASSHFIFFWRGDFRETL